MLQSAVRIQTEQGWLSKAHRAFPATHVITKEQRSVGWDDIFHKFRSAPPAANGPTSAAKLAQKGSTSETEGEGVKYE